MRFPWAAVSGLALLVIFFAVYFPVAYAGGFQGPVEDGKDYGEKKVGKPIEQPACFWSAIVFSLSGLALLLWCDLTTPVAGRPMEGRTVFSVPLGLLTVWLGPGSMLEHGTLRQTWGWFDASSIHWYAIYVIGYLILRWIPRGTESWVGRGVFWVAHLVACFLVGLCGALKPSTLEPWSIFLLVATGGMLLLTLCLQKPFGLEFENRQAGICFGMGIVMTGVGVAFQLGGGEKEFAEGWGHPTWHVLVALVTFCIFLILKSDRGRAASLTNPGQAPS